MGVVGAGGVSSAAPAMNLSFGASGVGASGGWTAGVGSPIDLTLGSPSDSTFALITLHHVAPDTVATMPEPSFATNAYNSGSPRWYVTLSNGDTLWGYPPQMSGGSYFLWAIDNGNSYVPWTTIRADETASGATVTGAWIIADGDQVAGTTNVITGLTFGTHAYN